MNEWPCQELHEKCLKAMEDWTDTSNFTQSFVSIEPINPYKDLEPRSLEYFDLMNDAYSRHEEARNKYYKLEAELAECMRKHGPKPK